MTRRLLGFILVAVAVVAAAVPAFAAQKQVTPKLDQRSMVRALSKARLALLTARSAKSESRRAARTAQAALNAANEAKNPAKGATAATGPAGASAPEIQRGIATASVTTDSETYVQLSGGPSVIVHVPPPGLIEVWAQVTLDDQGAVALFEDGQLMPGQSETCGPEPGDVALISAFGGETVTLATPGSFSIFGCGTDGPPSPVLFQTTPGTHTYELRYEFSECGCGGPDVTFSKRHLFVAPRI